MARQHRPRRPSAARGAKPAAAKKPVRARTSSPSSTTSSKTSSRKKQQAGTTRATVPSNVSTSFTERLAEKQKEARRRRTKRIALISVSLIVIIGLVYALFFSPLLELRSLSVKGKFTYSDQSLTEQKLGTLQGQSLLTLTNGRIERTIGDKWVESVDTHAIYPHALTVTVKERVPQAIVVRGSQRFLTDKTGTLLTTSRPMPSDLPTITIHPRQKAQSATYVDIGLTVLRHVPASLKGAVADIQIAPNKLVTMTLRDGRTVMWGDKEDLTFKSQVLETLLKAPGRTYDVSDPLNPMTGQ